MQYKEILNKLIPLMPFDFAQESVRQAHHERIQPIFHKRNQSLTVRPEPVEGLIKRFLK